MNERIKLTGAIEANANGIKSLESQCEEHQRKSNYHKEKADLMRQEIYARTEMGAAMARLQSIYEPTNETIYFVVPNLD